MKTEKGKASADVTNEEWGQVRSARRGLLVYLAILIPLTAIRYWTAMQMLLPAG